jgi:Hydroxyneurosporene synthase (CrtC).
MEYQFAGMGNQPETFEKLGLKKNTVEEWEDGIRTDGTPGTYEWWYFDSHLNGGSNLVIAIHTKDDMDSSFPEYKPFVTFELNTADGKSYNERVDFTKESFYASKETCNVHAGACTFIGNLHEYHIHFENENVTADVELTGSVPSWRPETGYMMFGDQGMYFAWLPSVPRGDVKADIVMNGGHTHYTGNGYHDHNWGNVPMISLIHDWYWGRAKIGDYTLISSYITAEETYGYHKFPIYMLVDANGKLYDNAECLTFEASDVEIDEATRKPHYNHVIYDYEDKSENVRFRISYNRQNTIAANKLINQLPEEARPIIESTGFDGAYIRFTGDVTLEKYENGVLVETASDNALWEMMYFGKTI